MQSALTPSTLFLFFKPSTPCPHSFVVGYWFLECSFSGVISAGCRSLQGVFCGCVSSKWVNVIFGAGWLELGMATYTEDISSVLWLCLTPLCDNFSSLQLFLSYLFFFMKAVPCSCNSALLLQHHPALPGEQQKRISCCVWGGRSALSSDRTDVCASLLAQRVIFTGSRGRLRSSHCWLFSDSSEDNCWMFLWGGTELPSSLGGQCGKKEHKFFRHTNLPSLSPAWDIKITQFVFHYWMLAGEEVPSFTNHLHSHSKLPE